MTQEDVAGQVPPAPQPPRLRHPGWLRRRVTRAAFWTLVGLAAALLITSLAVLIVTVRVSPDSSPTMEPTISSGDHLLVAPGTGIRRGDIVVLHVPASATGPDSTFVKRVIGLPGDHVACCDARGRVTVNGRPLNETYLYPGDRPSVVPFSVRLRKGQIWVMGDRRNISLDSRKWGPVSQNGVVGRVIGVLHGSSFTALRTPQAFVADGLAPPDTRLNHYLRLVFVAGACAAALVLLAIGGIVSSVIRGLRSRQAGPPQPGPDPDGIVPPPREPVGPQAAAVTDLPHPPTEPGLPA